MNHGDSSLLDQSAEHHNAKCKNLEPRVPHHFLLPSLRLITSRFHYYLLAAVGVETSVANHRLQVTTLHLPQSLRLLTRAGFGVLGV